METGTAGASSNGAASSAVSTGGADTGSSVDTGSDATEHVESAEGADGGEGGASSEPAADTRPKHKLRRGGRDLELAAEELAKMLDDDYEHDFHGAGGKPLLQDGKPVKMRWRDITRAVQMHHGATDAMRRHNEARQRVENEIAGLKGNLQESLPTFFAERLGVESYEDWIVEEAGRLLKSQDELLEIAKADPYKYQQELRKRTEADFMRKQKAKEKQQQAEQSQRQQAERMERHWQTVGSALSKVGLQLNERTRTIADRICREYAEARAELSFDQLAEYVRDAHDDEVFSYLDAHDDEALLKKFGDKRRERLRKAELAALKGKKATEKKAEPPANRSDPKEQRGMTADEFLRKGRNGGRV